MSGRRYKSTGCARFFVVLLILIPLAYFGARMIRGGEGIPAVDNYIESIFSGDDDKSESPNGDRESDESRIYKLTQENEALRERISDLEEEVEKLKKTVEDLSAGE